MPNKQPELLPCPFCGDKESLPYIHKENGLYEVHCAYCEALAPDSEDKYEAIEYWNTRADNKYRLTKRQRSCISLIIGSHTKLRPELIEESGKNAMNVIIDKIDKVLND